MDLRDEHKTTWNVHWQCINDSFETMFGCDVDYASLQANIYFVQKGNHRLIII